jgi:F-type H+-transporting ATPase subunit b
MDALGINLFSIVVYTILFIIIFIALEKFMLPGIRKSIAERKKLIEANQQKEQKLKDMETELVSKMNEDEKRVLKEAGNTSEEILTRASSEAQQIIEKAKSKAKNILDDAQNALVSKESKLDESFTKKVETRAMELLKEFYSDNKEELDQKLVEKFQKSLNKK